MILVILTLLIGQETPGWVNFDNYDTSGWSETDSIVVNDNYVFPVNYPGYIFMETEDGKSDTLYTPPISVMEEN
jgi:hypothetical protein